MQTEPCPHCSGSGSRVVPPPPERKGGQRKGTGRRHGYVATYVAPNNCRCDLCRAAWREAQKRYRAERIRRASGVTTP